MTAKGRKSKINYSKVRAIPFIAVVNFKGQANVLAAAFYVFLLFSESISHDFDWFVETTFSIGYDRLNGKVLGLVTLLIMFIIVRFTTGRRKKYDKDIVIFNQLSSENQAEFGNYIFITVLFGAIFSVLGCLFILH